MSAVPMMTLGPGRWPGFPAHAWSATPPRRSRASTPTPARWRPATCSSRSRASASTPTTSWREARARGAVAAIAHGGLEAAGLPGLEVPDTLAALGALAAGWRAQFELPLIAVTGSNGKTTVTQMIASILAAAGGGARAGDAPATSTTRSACR